MNSPNFKTKIGNNKIDLKYFTSRALPSSLMKLLFKMAMFPRDQDSKWRDAAFVALFIPIMIGQLHVASSSFNQSEANIIFTLSFALRFKFNLTQWALIFDLSFMSLKFNSLNIIKFNYIKWTCKYFIAGHILVPTELFCYGLDSSTQRYTH